MKVSIKEQICRQFSAFWLAGLYNYLNEMKYTDTGFFNYEASSKLAFCLYNFIWL